MKYRIEAAVILLSALAGVVVGLWPSSPDRIIVLSVGQGDCALIQSQGRAVLVDVGPNEGNAKGGLSAHLQRYGVESVDAVLLSHPDADHIGDISEIHRAFPKTPIFIPASFQYDKKLTKTCNSGSVQKIYWVSNADAQFGNFHLIIRSPKYNEKSNPDDNCGSMFVKCVDGTASYVTTGDAPAETETEMESVGDWTSEVMHVGHHGSRFSTALDWLDDVDPKIAIVSCGLRNRYGHPHQQTLDKLDSENIPVLRTDTMGDIELDVVKGHFVATHH